MKLFAKWKTLQGQRACQPNCSVCIMYVWLIFGQYLFWDEVKCWTVQLMCACVRLYCKYVLFSFTCKTGNKDDLNHGSMVVIQHTLQTRKKLWWRSNEKVVVFMLKFEMPWKAGTWMKPFAIHIRMSGFPTGPPILYLPRDWRQWPWFPCMFLGKVEAKGTFGPSCIWQLVPLQLQVQ